MTEIQKGQAVKILCTSFLEDGSALDENAGDAPLTMTAGTKGKNEFSTAVSNSLIGMKLKEIKHLKIPSRLAFGDHDQKKVYKLPLNGGAARSVGDEMQLKVSLGGGEEILDGVVIKVDEQFAHVDTNHPLAGQKLIVKIEVLSFN